jgi:hypothetical protein
MPRERRTVYVIKSLSWHYNDECTIPATASLHLAYARREDADRECRRLEILSRCGEGVEMPLQLAIDEEAALGLLQQLDVPSPPYCEWMGTLDWHHEGWHERMFQRLGPQGYEVLAQAFQADPYFYHVVETELET